MRRHKYSEYRPAWCEHPPFESIDYCWGLAVAVDEGKLNSFYQTECDTCDLSKHFNQVKFSKMIYEAQK